jgi:DNA topoisomerase-3
LKTLVIAEKPSVARDIAKVLNCSRKGEGFLFSEDYIVSWAIGHLVSLCDPEDYDPLLKRWRLEHLPIIPETIKLKAIASTRSQLAILSKLMNSNDTQSIICATDSGREGELIFRYIYNIVKCKKPFKRLWISSMTDAAIKDGFNNLKNGTDYDQLYLSAKCRSEADWLVGINASRAFTLKYNVLLSIGRVQTPTLAIITEKQKEIDAFVPQAYWEVKAFFNPPEYSGIWFDPQSKETKIMDNGKAEAIAAKVKGKTGSVLDIEKEEKRIPPPLLYDLTELQRDCNRKYGFSAQKTLDAAQALYEKHKMITYPRTDSRYLSTDMIPKLKSVLYKVNTGPYAPYASYALSLSQLPVTKRLVDDAKITDHHAIIPSEAAVNLSALGSDELKIYDLIVRRFISSFYPAYIYNIMKVITAVEDERFLTRGTLVVQLGWMELAPQSDKEDKDSEKEDEEELPNVKKGDLVTVQDSKIFSKKTKPPKPYTEATLLSAMENAGRFVDDENLKEQLKDSGLGTPATRAATIERLICVGYITRKGKALQPTEKGMKLIEVVPKELKSAETTGKWEKGLSSISKSTMDPNRFMQSINRFVNFLTDDAKKTKPTVVFPPEERKIAKKAALPKAKPAGGADKASRTGKATGKAAPGGAVKASGAAKTTRGKKSDPSNLPAAVKNNPNNAAPGTKE